MVSKATLLSSLEPLLSWSFADHTIPPAFRTQAEQVRPLALDLSMPVAIAGFVGCKQTALAVNSNMLNTAAAVCNGWERVNSRRMRAHAKRPGTPALPAAHNATAQPSLPGTLNLLQAGEWEPLQRYCETHSYEVYREFELMPVWQAWFVRAANVMLSALGPPSLLRLRPTGSPYQFGGLAPAPAARTADAADAEKKAAGPAEEAADVGAGAEAPPTFSVQMEE